jgi:hypothetical protein
MSSPSRTLYSGSLSAYCQLALILSSNNAIARDIVDVTTNNLWRLFSPGAVNIPACCPKAQYHTSGY